MSAVHRVGRHGGCPGHARRLRIHRCRILTFEISELKTMANGGRGLMLIDLDDKDTLAGAAAYTRSVKIEGIGRGGKAREETLEIRSLNNARAARGRKGKAADLGFKPTAVSRLE